MDICGYVCSCDVCLDVICNMIAALNNYLDLSCYEYVMNCVFECTAYRAGIYASLTTSTTPCTPDACGVPFTHSDREVGKSITSDLSYVYSWIFR